MAARLPRHFCFETAGTKLVLLGDAVVVLIAQRFRFDGARLVLWRDVSVGRVTV